MELRKDPITRSWVITGDDVPDHAPRAEAFLPVLCGLAGGGASGFEHAGSGGRPLVGACGGASRAALPRSRVNRPGVAMEFTIAWRRWARTKCWWRIRAHDRQLWNASDAEIEQFLLLAAHRIQDLKRDARFKYVSIFKNHGSSAGQEFEHPTSQLTATTFVPRRVLYELRAGRDYFKAKERCVFCDIISQELQQNLRVIEVRGDFIALCPYAPRVPYETWIIPRTHEAAFERFGLTRPASMLDLAALLRRTLQRIRTVTGEFHLVLHTSPNTLFRSKSLDYWKTIDDDYHWHIEILPVITGKAKSYTFKEVYYSPVSSESAVKLLREARIEG